MAGTPTAKTGNTAPALTWATVMLLIWAFCFYTIRIWVKTGLRRLEALDAEDILVSGSFLIAICHVVTVCIAVKHGFGNHWDTISADDLTQVQKSLYASQILYITSLGLTRLSSAFFVFRLSRHKWHKLIAKGVLAFIALWMIVSIFVICFRGKLAHPWTTLDGSSTMFHRWLGVEISGASIDLFLWASSAFLVYSLQMPIIKRLGVILVFGTKLLILPFIVLRLHYLSPAANSSTHPNTAEGIFTELVMEVGLMLTTVTCLKPVLRPFHAGYFIRHTDVSGSGQKSGLKAVSGNTYYMLSGAKDTQKSKKSALSTTVRSENDEGEDRFTPLPKVFVPPERGGDYQATVAPEEGISASSATDQHMISKTQTWAVEYEDNNQKPLQQRL